MRVLQVFHGLGMGGAERWLMELLRHRTNNSIDFEVLLTGGVTGLFDGEVQSLSVPLHRIQYDQAHALSFASQFRGLIRRGAYDIVHDHQDLHAGYRFAMIADMSGAPRRIAHFHNSRIVLDNHYKTSLRRRLVAGVGLQLVRRFATRILGTSGHVLLEYGIDPIAEPRASVQYCGFDQSVFCGDKSVEKASLCREFSWPLDSKIILFVGRMDVSPLPSHPDNSKNSAFAVEVAAKCIERYPNCRALFVGQTTDALKAHTNRLAAAGLQQKVRFTGIRSDVPRMMVGSDVLLFPSRGEGLGMVAVEAQAAGLPVAASDCVPAECCILPEIVRFVSLNADVEKWAEIVYKLSQTHYDNLAANALVYRSDFNIENSYKSLIMKYKT